MTHLNLQINIYTKLIGMKKCNRCFIEKQLKEFCNKTSSKDGKGNTCFPCVKEYND